MSGIDGGEPTDAQRGVTSGAEAQKPSVTHISPAILTSLGLTDKDLKDFDEKEVKKREKMEEAVRNGEIAYAMELKGNQGGSMLSPDRPLAHTGFDLIFLDRVPSSLDMYPDAFIEQRERNKADPRLQRAPGFYDEDLPYLKKWMEGFGNAALKQDDWKTALNAFDIAMDGDVMGNQKLMERLKTIAGTNRPEGIKIAKTIQAKVDKTAATRSSQATHGAPSI